MRSTTIDFGIYLGNDYSAVAALQDARAVVIKDSGGWECMPSTVWIDPRGQLWVGRVAREQQEYDPQNVTSDFMAQIGTKAHFRFERSGRVMTAEELAAEVLKALRREVQQRLGEDMTAAVITVPAAFELPQCDATRRAAQLAGLQFSPLIMEPTAAAMAHAFSPLPADAHWLVYDLGGGTFDAAVIQMREGAFRIVNHAGDNHLGGKLIDWEIVEKLLAPAAATQYRVNNFNRGNPHWRSAFAKLIFAVRNAREDLSTRQSSEIIIDDLCMDDNGEPVPFEYELNRAEVVRLARPFIQRSLQITRQMLAEIHLDIVDIAKAIPLGGDILHFPVRQLLTDSQEGLGIPLDFSVNPLTAAAEGAAVFALTQRLQDSRPCAANEQPPTARPSLLKRIFLGDRRQKSSPTAPIRLTEKVWLPPPVKEGGIISFSGGQPLSIGTPQESGKVLPAIFLQPDKVDLAVTAPQKMVPAESYVINAWIYPTQQKRAVMKIEREMRSDERFSTATRLGALVERGALLAVRLHLPGFTVNDPEEETIHWDGSPANASFLVTVPQDKNVGDYAGVVTFHARGLPIARVIFRLAVASRSRPASPLPAETHWLKTAFASYAHEDRAEMLRRVQGMQVINPNLDIFIDAVSLRAGEKWEARIRNEILGRDVFFLFWSSAARRSEWVQKEWHIALEQRGIEVINPVPLEPPDVAPPPPELSALHFNDPLIGILK